jgi:O-antigen ligase
VHGRDLKYSSFVRMNDSHRFRMLVIGVSFSTLLIIPSIWDSTVLPKFFVIVLLVGLLAYPSLVTLKLHRKNKIVLAFTIMVACLIMLSFISSLLSEDSFGGIYGKIVRHNGTLHIAAILLIFLIAFSSAQRNQLRFLFNLLVIVGLIQSLVGLAQYFGFQLFEAKNPYSPILGFFGNPNHVSALLGLSLIACMHLALKERVKTFQGLIYIVVGVLCLANIVLSNSIQGLFTFLIGGCIYTLGHLISRWAWFFSFLLASLTLAIFSVFGFANAGPLASVLYQDSNLYRWNYWTTAISAIQEKPILGYGPDQFDKAYLTLRSFDIVRVNERTTDNAHNWFLQLGSTHGLLFLAIFFALILLISVNGLRARLKYPQDSDVVAVTALWFGFLGFSLISVEHISLTALGMTFGGVLLRLSLNNTGEVREVSGSVTKSKRRKAQSNKYKGINLPSVTLLFVSLLLLAPVTSVSSLLSEEVRRSSPNPTENQDYLSLKERLDGFTYLGGMSPWIYIKIVEERLARGDLITGELLLDSVLRSYPSQHLALQYKAYVLETKGENRAALEYRKRVSALYPTLTNNLRELIRLADELQDLDVSREARATYRVIYGEDFRS